MSCSPERLNTFPIFLKVEDRRVVIVGDGEEAFAKARLLAQTSASLVVVGAQLDPAFAAFIAERGIEHVVAPYTAAVLRGSALVFAATGEEAVDRQVVEDARTQAIPANAVDRPHLCDFLTPCIVNRAPLAVAIGTEGTGPVLAQIVREKVDAMLSPSLGPLARVAASLRDKVEHALPKGSPRRAFWRGFFAGKPARMMAQGRPGEAVSAAEDLLAAGIGHRGHVSLVGAGPGAEDLLTLRAQRLLMEADVVVYDALVPEAVVAMARRDAERLPVGKRKGCHSKTQGEISALLVELGQAGKRVVRLKSGDPLVFGRAAEEMQALRDAGISFDIVPGVTSALAAAADFGLPLTLRGVSSSLVFTTGHDLKGNSLPDWGRLAISGATVAIYMGRSVAADVASRLIEAGLSPDTAVAVVESASLSDQRRFHGTLADLPSLSGRRDLDGPVMTIIGDAVAGADFSASTPLSAIREPVLPVEVLS